MTNEQQAAALYGQFVDELRSGGKPDIESFASKCDPSEQEGFRAAAKAAVFMWKNLVSTYVSDDVVNKTVARINNLGRIRERLETAREQLTDELLATSPSPAESLAAALQFPISVLKSPPRLRSSTVYTRQRSGSASGDLRSDVEWMQRQLLQKQAAEKAEEAAVASEIDRFPVDLDMVCKRFNLLVMQTALNEDVDGLIVTDGETGGILINTRVGDSRRRRFTLAHEIGHYVLHRQYGYFRDMLKTLGDYSDDTEEMEANTFAGALLMPLFLLPKSIGERPPDFDTASELADDFDASFTAACIRAVRTSPWRCALVCLDGGVVQWSIRSESFRHGIKKNSRPHPSSAAAWLSTQPAVRAKSMHVPAKFWLEYTHEDEELFEQSYLLAEDLVYTLLAFEDVS